MCKLKSGIILKNRVFVPEYDSHTDMLKELGIEDNYLNASKTFVRVELSPEDEDVFSDIDTWKLNVDQDILPDWYDEEAYKPQVIEAVKKWAEEHIHNGVKFLDISTGRNHYIKDCYYISITQNAEVELICGNSTVYEIRDDAKVKTIVENVRIDTIKDNVKVETLLDNSIIENVTGNTKIGSLYGHARIRELSDKAIIRNVGDYASVEAIEGYAEIESVSDNAFVKYASEDAIIDEAWGYCVIEAITGRAMIKNLSGYSRVEGVYEEAIIKKASGCSIVVNHSISNWENKQKLKLSDGAILQDETEDVIYHTKEWKCVEVGT